MKKPYKFIGREQEYRTDYRIANRGKIKAYNKIYNRAYYLKHRGLTVKNPIIPR